MGMTPLAAHPWGSALAGRWCLGSAGSWRPGDSLRWPKCPADGACYKIPAQVGSGEARIRAVCACASECAHAGGGLWCAHTRAGRCTGLCTWELWASCFCLGAWSPTGWPRASVGLTDRCNHLQAFRHSLLILFFSPKITCLCKDWKGYAKIGRNRKATWDSKRHRQDRSL